MVVLNFPTHSDLSPFPALSTNCADRNKHSQKPAHEVEKDVTSISMFRSFPHLIKNGISSNNFRTAVLYLLVQTLILTEMPVRLQRIVLKGLFLLCCPIQTVSYVNPIEEHFPARIF